MKMGLPILKSVMANLVLASYYEGYCEEEIEKYLESYYPEEMGKILEEHEKGTFEYCLLTEKLFFETFKEFFGEEF